MTIEIDKNFETILLCAVRYAIGRKSYMPSLVIDYITPLIPHLSDNYLKLIGDEIMEKKRIHQFGDEKIDKPYWLAFLHKITEERNRRAE